MTLSTLLTMIMVVQLLVLVACFTQDIRRPHHSTVQVMVPALSLEMADMDHGLGEELLVNSAIIVTHTMVLRLDMRCVLMD